MIQFIFHSAVILAITYLAMQLINKKFPIPEERDWETSDTAFLAMCCRRAQMNVGQIFHIAAKKHGFNLEDKTINKDVSLFLRNSRTPFYVDAFIREGREAMKKEESCL